MNWQRLDTQSPADTSLRLVDRVSTVYTTGVGPESHETADRGRARSPVS